ncbi:MAG: hypothetical protein CMC14_11285 [Flavobacteriaceae bacterium]|nr:hypothetical protein [Flavobacteriaceae bacterium]
MKNIFVKNHSLTLSTIIILLTLIVVIFTNISINNKHYFGILLFLCSLILAYLNRQFYNYFFGIVLLAGIFGLVDFLFFDVRIGYKLFKVNPIFIFLFILHIVTIRKTNSK